MMSKIKQNRILTIASIFALVGILTIAYAAFTSNLNISGTGVNRNSNFDIYFNNVSAFLTTGTATVTDPTPTSKNHTTVIEDYNATLTTPGDSIYFTFDIVNDGDYDATLSSLTLGSVKCSVISNGYVTNDFVGMIYAVRPVVYLISDIAFEGNHTGSSTDHYVLKK